MNDLTESKRRFFDHPAFAPSLLILLAFFLNWPFLTGGLAADDYILFNSLQNKSFDLSLWRGVWGTDVHASFLNIWWVEPGWRAFFWRPLPSLMLEASLYLFGRHPLPLHLLSLLLHAGVTVGLYFLVRKLTARRTLAFLSALLYVTCEDHSMTVGWIATFTDLLCVLFILMTLLSHINWLQKRKPVWLFTALLTLLIALSCKETAVIAPVIMFMLTFLMPQGTAEADITRSEFKNRIKKPFRDPVSWLPALLIMVIYLAAYKLLNLGGVNNLMYIDPVAHPELYLSHLILHLPMMWAGTLSILPFVSWFAANLLLPFAIIGTVLFLFWLLALRPFRFRPLAWWALGAYLIALLPQLNTDASERGLYFPLIFGSILLAMTVMTVKPLRRRLFPDAIFPRLTRIFGWFVIVTVLVPGFLISATRPWALMPAFEKPVRELRTALPYIEQRKPEHVLILNTSGLILTVYTWDILNFYSEREIDVWPLSSANGVLSLERTGDSSFVIRTDRPGWINNWFARLFRTELNLDPAGRYEKKFFTATILEMTEDKSDVLAVRFDLNKPLNYPGWLFLRWNGEKYEPLDIASLEIGKRVELANTSDLLKSMM
jgi:hypothetical protein